MVQNLGSNNLISEGGKNIYSNECENR
jgi:hypothetical protein